MSHLFIYKHKNEFMYNEQKYTGMLTAHEFEKVN